MRVTIRRLVTAGIALVLVAVPGACGDEEPSAGGSPADDGPGATATEPADAPETVTCGTQYRPVGGESAGELEDSLSVNRPTGEEMQDRDSVSFADFGLSAMYSDDGFETPALLIIVSSPDDAEIERVLYQFNGSLPTFAGGDDFTGLHYVYSGKAELQWWCSAEG